MAKKLKPEPDDKDQSSRFVETARNLESDESGKPFRSVFQDIVRPKAPKPKSPLKRPKK